MYTEEKYIFLILFVQLFENKALEKYTIIYNGSTIIIINIINRSIGKDGFFTPLNTYIFVFFLNKVYE